MPTLDDNGFLVTDSHAIISYLAAGSTLTSPDARLAARINQLLFFDFELFRVMGEVGVSSNARFVAELGANWKVFGALFFRFHCSRKEPHSRRKKRWWFCMKSSTHSSSTSNDANGCRVTSWRSQIFRSSQHFPLSTWAPRSESGSSNVTLIAFFFHCSTARLISRSTRPSCGGLLGARKTSSAMQPSRRTRKMLSATSWNQRALSWSLTTSLQPFERSALRST